MQQKTYRKVRNFNTGNTLNILDEDLIVFTSSTITPLIINFTDWRYEISNETTFLLRGTVSNITWNLGSELSWYPPQGPSNSISNTVLKLVYVPKSSSPETTGYIYWQWMDYPDYTEKESRKDLFMAYGVGSNGFTFSTLTGYTSNGVQELFTDGTILTLPEVYDTENAYDPNTGIWTCKTAGIYNVMGYLHLTKSSGFNGSGYMLFGIVSVYPSNGYYGVGAFTLVPGIPVKHIDISVQAPGVNIPVDTQIALRVLNLTGSGSDYSNYIGDGARFAIQRLSLPGE